MAFQNDTSTVESNVVHPEDPQHVGSGTADAPGGSNAPTQTQSDMTQGQDAYPGSRLAGEAGQPQNLQAGNETGLNGDTPAAGDIDPGSTASAEETGQDGDPKSPGKNTANPWNG